MLKLQEEVLRKRKRLLSDYKTPSSHKIASVDEDLYKRYCLDSPGPPEYSPPISVQPSSLYDVNQTGPPEHSLHAQPQDFQVNQTSNDDGDLFALYNIDQPVNLNSLKFKAPQIPDPTTNFNKCDSFEINCEPIQPPSAPDDTPSNLNYNNNPVEQFLDCFYKQYTNEFLAEELEEPLEKSSRTFGAVNSPPVYRGAPITLHESLVCVLCLALRFSMSGQLINGVLKLIDLHLPKEDNVFQSSLYLFKKYFSEIKGSASYTNYCAKCFSVCDKKEGCSCGNKKEMCTLVQLSLIEQLQTLFKRKGFFSKLIPIEERKGGNGAIRDIFDGEMYKMLLEQGVISNPQDLSFLWYTDGAALFESSSISVWTVYLTINELPYSERFKKENLLVPALWIGPVKPNGNILLNATVPDLQRLRDGVDFEIADVGTKNVKACVLCGTADTPARALMLNMVAHNGEYACQRCEQQGECREGCSGVRVFPYLPDEMIPRSSASASRQGYLSFLLKDHYLGFKGPTTLNKISLDFIRGCGLDSMHLIFGGVGKLSLKFFLESSSTFTGFSCNLGKAKKETANSRLMQIKPPHYMTRTPRSIHDAGSWQTSLHKAMLLHYGLPVFEGLIGAMHMKHYATLVAATQMLNADIVRDEDLSRAHELITKYVAYFEDIYCKKFMTLNVHLLLHLVEVVKDLGPLWVTSCFPQEGINASILSLVHGTRFPEMQIASSLNMCLGLPDIIANLPVSSGKEFCEKVTSKTHNYKSFKFGENTVVGLWHPLAVEDNLKDIIEEYQFTGNVTQFHCLRRNRVLYAAESYTRSTVKDSSSVLFRHDTTSKVGLIKTFVRTSTCQCSECLCICSLYAIIQELKVIASFPTLVHNITVPNTHKYERLQTFHIVPVDCLDSVNVKMEINGKLYISKRCNRHEVE